MENIARFFIKVIEDFNSSVIYQERYLLILEGLLNTIIIALGAIVLGVIIGAAVSLVRYTYKKTKKLKTLNKIFNAYVFVIRGTPALLQLMIIYYVIFKTSNINPIIIGILAFGINSGAYTAEIMRSGLDSTDDGQLEAGLSLGLTFFQTLKSIIIPQAIKNCLPSIGNEFITLIKETAIAGYIGITDLTKASDIIASRTYNYFFPLIIIALIYLFITSMLSKLMRTIERKMSTDDNN